MTTKARLGIDILAFDKTRAAFASVDRSMRSFNKSINFAKGLIVGGMFAGFGRQMVEIARMSDEGERAFNRLSGAWFNFKANAGDSGLTVGITNIANALSDVLSAGNNLSSLLGGALGQALSKIADAVSIVNGAVRVLAESFEWLSNKTGTLASDLSTLLQIFPGIGVLFADWGQTATAVNQVADAISDTNNAAKEFVPQISNMADKTGLLFGKLENGTLVIEKVKKKTAEHKDVVAETILSLQQYVTGLEQQQAAFGASEGALARLAKSQDVYNALQKAGVTITAAQRMEIEGLLDKLEASVTWTDQNSKALKAFEERQKEVTDAMDGLASTMASAFGSAFISIKNGSASVSDAIKSMVDSIIDSLAQLAINKLFMMLFKSFAPDLSFYGGGTIMGLSAGPALSPAGGSPGAGPARGFGPIGGGADIPSRADTIVNLKIISSGGGDASVKESRGADGSLNIEAIIEPMVTKALAKGKADKVMATRYGSGVRARRR